MTATIQSSGTFFTATAFTLTVQLPLIQTLSIILALTFNFG